MTSQVALIGSPLRRPHSAVMHNAAFVEFGIDAQYELRSLEPKQLDDFFTEVRTGDWLGFQVTAPYKQEAARRCDEVEHDASVIGAVNSVLKQPGGMLIGFNTDAPGFARSVGADLGLSLGGCRVAVAGAGGAARAVVHACLTEGAAEVIVGSRVPAAAEELVASFDDNALSATGLGPSFDGVLGGVDLAVNATTVGMTSPGMVFDPGRLGPGARLFDLVYVPPATPLIAAARSAGVPAVNGLGMLVSQAEIAFERWTQRSGAGPVMRRALESMQGPEQA